MSVKPVAIAAIVLVMVVAAGCGGSKKTSATPPASSTASSTTTASAASTTAASTTSAPKFASTKNCQQLSALGAKVSQALQSSSGAGTGSLGDEAKVFKALTEAAPAEIRGDFKTFADAFSAYAEALTKAGFKPGEVPTAAQLAEMATAAKAFSTAKLQAAEQHLASWAQKNCGIGTGK